MATGPSPGKWCGGKLKGFSQYGNGLRFEIPLVAADVRQTSSLLSFIRIVNTLQLLI